MISRQYVVLMPEEAAGDPVQILIESNPGTQAEPATAGMGHDYAYYELRGRSLRCPNPAGATTPNGQPNFIPRFRLGVNISLVPITARSGITPQVQLSESLLSLSSTDGGPTISVPAFPDPAGGPCIQLTGDTDTAGQVYLLSVMIPEAKDEDRDGTGI